MIAPGVLIQHLYAAALHLVSCNCGYSSMLQQHEVKTSPVILTHNSDSIRPISIWVCAQSGTTFNCPLPSPTIRGGRMPACLLECSTSSFNRCSVFGMMAHRLHHALTKCCCHCCLCSRENLCIDRSHLECPSASHLSQNSRAWGKGCLHRTTFPHLPVCWSTCSPFFS